jgi:UDP-GlcNAc:undecaprenyl-phosphate GlcNAc-1-phosphate transferase
LAHATFPLAGALLGFLCFNFNPATVFLGDSGALQIGFLLGCFGMIWTSKTATLLSVAAPILTLSIPLLDVSLAIVRRGLKRQPIFGADRGHIHHRLLDLGFSPRDAVLVLYVTAVTAAGFGLLLSQPMLGRYQLLLVLAFTILVFAGIKQLRYAEFNVAKKMLFGGFQRTLVAKMQLEQFSSALYQTRTEQEWWAALTSAARAAGWTRISWTGVLPREETLSSHSAEWCFEVLLPAGEAIRMEGVSGQEGEASVNLLEFASAVRGSFAGLEREPKRLARS